MNKGVMPENTGNYRLFYSANTIIETIIFTQLKPNVRDRTYRIGWSFGPWRNWALFGMLNIKKTVHGWMTVVVQQLQPANPFRLEYGKRALLQAHQAMRHALEKPIDGQLIHV